MIDDATSESLCCLGWQCRQHGQADPAGLQASRDKQPAMDRFDSVSRLVSAAVL